MPRYINVDYIPFEDGFDRENGDEHFIIGVETMQEWIRSQDAIYVVKCKDCRWFKKGSFENCCNLLSGMTDPVEDGFCSYAEEKDD